MTLFITTPVPYFNFMAIIVSTAVLLWFARALKRFARIIAVRSAAIDDSIVHVRGVGHTLIVFEGAPRRHLEAIIHTRPTMPPSQMNVLYHPYIIRNAEIKAMVNREGYYVDLHIWVASQTLVLVLSNIKVNLFKETFKSARDTAQLVMNTIKRNPEDSRYIRQNEFTEFLSRNGVVTHVSQPVSLAPGSHSVQVPFHPPGRRGPQPNQVQISESIDKTFFSLMIIPLGCVSSFNAAGNNNQPSSSLKRRGETSSSGFFSRLPFSLRSLSSGGRDASSNSVSLSRTFLSGHQSQKSEVESNADGSTAVSDLKKNAGDENTAATQPIQLDLQQVDFALYVIENAGAAAPLLIPSSDPLTGRRNSVEDQEGDASTNTPSFMQMFQPNSSFRVSVLGEDGAADTQSNEVASTKPTSTESSAGNIAANCAEQVICTSNGNLYSMNEIYGMKQKPLPQRVPLPPSDVTVVKKGAVKGEYEKVGAMTDLEDETGDPVDGTPRSKRTTSGDVEEVAKEEVKKDAAADEGDSSLDDDCVVCLTNPKTTFLIPCRHMCVCSDCLKQVDKCPVCRTPFDEYIEVNALSTYLYAPVCR